MAANVSVELVRLGVGTSQPKNVIAEMTSPAVLFATLTTVDDTDTVVGVAGWCWRVAVRSGMIRANAAAAASSTAGILIGAEASRVEVIACVDGVPLSVIEVS